VTPRTLGAESATAQAKGGDSSVEDEETAGGDAGNRFARGCPRDAACSRRIAERAARMRRCGKQHLRLARSGVWHGESLWGLSVLRSEIRRRCGVSFADVEVERFQSQLTWLILGATELLDIGEGE
jgi:hypothetical protein